MQSEAISKCDHHCESIYREMTKQLLPHYCRDGGSACLSRLSSLLAAPSPPSSARSCALAAQPSPAQPGTAPGSRDPPGRPRPGLEPAGPGRSAAGEGRRELTELWQMESLNTHQSLPCMLMCQGGDEEGKGWHELHGSLPELPVCLSWLSGRRGQGKRDSFWTRK